MRIFEHLVTGQRPEPQRPEPQQPEPQQPTAHSPQPSSAGAMNATLPRYRLLSSLGKGGMGEGFLADATQLGRKVGIKFLTTALDADSGARERLHRESRSAAALDNPFICKIH